MHRLPLFLCLIALVGSGVSAALYFQIGNSKQLLEHRLGDVSARATKLDADLAATNEQNGSLKAKLGALQLDLERTNAKLAHADTKAAQLTRDLGAAKDEIGQVKNVLAVYETTAKALADEVSSLREDLEESRSSNASPEAVLGYKQTISELEKQLADARNGAVALATPGGPTAVFTSRAGRATVLTVGPENAFVVLNFGSARGAKLGQKLTVSQGADEVATVLISDVRTHFSIAQVLPETLRAALQKGDSAILIR